VTKRKDVRKKNLGTKNPKQIIVDHPTDLGSAKGGRTTRSKCSGKEETHNPSRGYAPLGSKNASWGGGITGNDSRVGDLESIPKKRQTGQPGPMRGQQLENSEPTGHQGNKTSPPVSTLTAGTTREREAGRFSTPGIRQRHGWGKRGVVPQPRGPTELMTRKVAEGSYKKGWQIPRNEKADLQHANMQTDQGIPISLGEKKKVRTWDRRGTWGRSTKCGPLSGIQEARKKMDKVFGQRADN